MKRKFLTTALTALLAVSTLSACGANYKVSFNDYWKKSVFDSAQQTLTETCEYDVGFESTAVGNFSVAYQNGTYKTTFISTTTTEQQVEYTFTTEFSIQVQYKVGNDTSQWLDDSAYTSVTFHSSKDGLMPIRSEKRMVSHSPLNISPSSLEVAYKKYDQTIVTQYDEKCESATATITDNKLTQDNVTTQTFDISHSKYNYLDNESLLFALRCINTDATTSTKFNIYSPLDADMQKFSVNFNTATSKDFTFSINGESAVSRSVSYYPVGLQLSANTNTGTLKSIWIAKRTDAQNNTYRNVILRQETPLAYALGTLTFSLKSINFAN